MDKLPAIETQGIAYYMAKDVFNLLGVKSFRHQIDGLSDGDYNKDLKAVTLRGLFKIVFSSRTAATVEVQDMLLARFVGSGKPAVAPAAPAVVQEAPLEIPVEPEPPQPSFDTLLEVPKPPPKPETPTLAMSTRDFDMLDTLDCYRSQVYGMGKAITAMRAAIESIAEKYTMPEDAWLNCQLEQVMALMPDDALETQFLQDDIWQFYALHVQDRPWLEASTLRCN